MAKKAAKKAAKPSTASSIFLRAFLGLTESPSIFDTFLLFFRIDSLPNKIKTANATFLKTDKNLNDMQSLIDQLENCNDQKEYRRLTKLLKRGLT